MKREYALRLIINGRILNRVLIDSHYESKHADTINDNLILDLVKTLNGRYFEYETVNSAGWEIYVHDPLYWNGKPYRLIWCLHSDENYIGVINSFRRR